MFSRLETKKPEGANKERKAYPEKLQCLSCTIARRARLCSYQYCKNCCKAHITKNNLECEHHLKMEMRATAKEIRRQMREQKAKEQKEGETAQGETMQKKKQISSSYASKTRATSKSISLPSASPLLAATAGGTSTNQAVQTASYAQNVANLKLLNLKLQFLQKNNSAASPSPRASSPMWMFPASSPFSGSSSSSSAASINAIAKDFDPQVAIQAAQSSSSSNGKINSAATSASLSSSSSSSSLSNTRSAEKRIDNNPRPAFYARASPYAPLAEWRRSDVPEYKEPAAGEQKSYDLQTQLWRNEKGPFLCGWCNKPLDIAIDPSYAQEQEANTRRQEDLMKASDFADLKRLAGKLVSTKPGTIAMSQQAIAIEVIRKHFKHCNPLMYKQISATKQQHSDPTQVTCFANVFQRCVSKGKSSIPVLDHRVRLKYPPLRIGGEELEHSDDQDGADKQEDVPNDDKLDNLNAYDNVLMRALSYQSGDDDEEDEEDEDVDRGDNPYNSDSIQIESSSSNSSSFSSVAVSSPGSISGTKRTFTEALLDYDVIQHNQLKQIKRLKQIVQEEMDLASSTRAAGNCSKASLNQVFPGDALQRYTNRAALLKRLFTSSEAPSDSKLARNIDNLHPESKYSYQLGLTSKENTNDYFCSGLDTNDDGMAKIAFSSVDIEAYRKQLKDLQDEIHKQWCRNTRFIHFLQGHGQRWVTELDTLVRHLEEKDKEEIHQNSTNNTNNTKVGNERDKDKEEEAEEGGTKKRNENGYLPPPNRMVMKRPESAHKQSSLNLDAADEKHEDMAQNVRDLVHQDFQPVLKKFTLAHGAAWTADLANARMRFSSYKLPTPYEHNIQHLTRLAKMDRPNSIEQIKRQERHYRSVLLNI